VGPSLKNIEILNHFQQILMSFRKGITVNLMEYFINCFGSAFLEICLE